VNSANNSGSRNGKCYLHFRHIPIFHSGYCYAHDEGVGETSRHDGGILCDVHLDYRTRYMVRYAQDEDQPQQCVDNPTPFNSKLSAAKRERPYFTISGITNFYSLDAVVT
jgi:hypothetical protein